MKKIVVVLMLLCLSSSAFAGTMGSNKIQAPVRASGWQMADGEIDEMLLMIGQLQNDKASLDEDVENLQRLNTRYRKEIASLRGRLVDVKEIKVEEPRQSDEVPPIVWIFVGLFAGAILTN